jgi:hypothetical protein
LYPSLSRRSKKKWSPSAFWTSYVGKGIHKGIDVWLAVFRTENLHIGTCQFELDWCGIDKHSSTSMHAKCSILDEACVKDSIMTCRINAIPPRDAACGL